MKARSNAGFRGRLLMGVAGLAMLVLAIGAPPAQAASAGQPAYDFHGTTVGGQQVSLASHAGKPLVLVLWASW